jgi:hypothetical protein
MFCNQRTVVVCARHKWLVCALPMSPKVQRGNSLNYKNDLSSISVITLRWCTSGQSRYGSLRRVAKSAYNADNCRRDRRLSLGSDRFIGVREMWPPHKLVRELPPTLRNSPRNPNVGSASFGAVIMENQSQISPKSINAQTPKFLNSPAMQDHLNAIHWVGRARK